MTRWQRTARYALATFAIVFSAGVYFAIRDRAPSAPATTLLSGPIGTGTGDLGSGLGEDPGARFGDAVVNPPVEAQLIDAAFEGDDDDLDIPEFLR